MAKWLIGARALEAICILTALPVLTLSQAISKTAAPCSPIAPYNKGVITIRCSVSSDKVGKQLIEILNRIEKNQLNPQLVMGKLNEILREVNPNLPVKTYLCDGHWRTAGPGPNAAFEVNMGGDNSVFKEMVDLANTRHSQALINLCLAQIQASPGWLTPRLFCALGYFFTGDAQKAKAMLKEFDASAGPAYNVDGCKEVSDFLHAKLR